MPRLHLLCHPAALDDCRAQIAAGDVVLLLDQGVVLLGRPGAADDLAATAGRLVISSLDLAARGLVAPAGFDIVDDAGMVALVERHEQVLSWS